MKHDINPKDYLRLKKINEELIDLAKEISNSMNNVITKDSNIKMILELKKEFNVQVGLSDHTLNNTAALAAVALGACAIEKHFILNKRDKSPDSTFSIDPKELKILKQDTKDCWESIGQGEFQRSNSESKNIIFRRSLYFFGLCTTLPADD